MSGCCFTPMRCPSFFGVDSDCETVNHSIKVVDGDLAENSAAISALIIQLGTDRFANGERGFWGEQFMAFPIGNRLWTLTGSVGAATQVTVLADQMVREAVEPLISQGFFDEIKVNAVRTIDGVELTLDALKDGQSLFSVVVG